MTNQDAAAIFRDAYDAEMARQDRIVAGYRNRARRPTLVARLARLSVYLLGGVAVGHIASLHNLSAAWTLLCAAGVGLILGTLVYLSAGTTATD